MAAGNTFTSDLLQQVIGKLRSDLGSRPSDKRHSARVGLRARVKLVARHPDGPLRLEARVRDLSASGIGLLIGRRMPRGAEFIVTFPNPNGGVGLQVLYRVTRCIRAADDLYLLGGVLVPTLDDRTPSFGGESVGDETDEPREERW